MLFIVSSSKLPSARTEGNTALGESSPANPALEFDVPISTTTAETSSVDH